MTLKHAKTFFPEFLSPCCNAPVFRSICQKCENIVPMPFFLVSMHPISDEVALGVEAKLRPDLPVGIEMVLRVGDYKPNL